MVALNTAPAYFIPVGARSPRLIGWNRSSGTGGAPAYRLGAQDVIEPNEDLYADRCSLMDQFKELGWVTICLVLIIAAGAGTLIGYLTA